jgi:hypothetical protein
MAAQGVGYGNEGSGTTRKTQSAPESRTRRVTTSGTHLPQPENHDRYDHRPSTGAAATAAAGIAMGY